MAEKINDLEDLVKRTQEIIDELSCVASLEDQVLKLYCIIKNCVANHTEEGTEMITRQYMLEKLTRVINSIPLIMDKNASKMFVAIKLKEEIQQDGTTTPGDR